MDVRLLQHDIEILPTLPDRDALGPRSLCPKIWTQEDVVGHVPWEGGILHTTNAFIVSIKSSLACMN